MSPGTGQDARTELMRGERGAEVEGQTGGPMRTEGGCGGGR